MFFLMDSRVHSSAGLYQILRQSGFNGWQTVDDAADWRRRDGAAKKSVTVRNAAPRPIMAAAHVFTRYAHPRYEVRGAAGGAVPCANVPHVVESLQRLGAPQITDAQVYALVREGGEQSRAALLLPDGVTVHRLTEAERWQRPLFRVTRTYEPGDPQRHGNPAFAGIPVKDMCRVTCGNCNLRVGH